MFLADLAHRILLLSGLLIFLVPLTSLTSAHGIGAVQLVEAIVLLFIVGALARSILNGRLFMDSRLARPALVFAAVIAASGLCNAFEQSADASLAFAGLWRSAKSYFASPFAANQLQPTLRWLEFSALVPTVPLVRLVEMMLSPSRRRAKALLTVGLAAGAVILLWEASRASVASQAGTMRLALETAGAAPIFGVGPGGFAWVSPDGAEPRYLLPVVILVEFGCIGLVVLVGLLWRVFRPMNTSARFRSFDWMMLAIVLISLPWRIGQSLAPATPEIAGAGPVKGELEGVAYRTAGPVSRWRLHARSRTFTALMRWDSPAADDCRLRISVTDRPADEVSLRADAWIPVRLSIPPRGPHERADVEFRVSSASCLLLVGTVTVTK